ncbi:MAG: hypothetical protein AAFZ52_04890, partial [Bacteroidota bacterium]
YWLKRFGLTFMDYHLPSVTISSILLCAVFLRQEVRSKYEWVNRLIGFIGDNTLTIFVANPLVVVLVKRSYAGAGISCESTLWYLIVPFVSAGLVMLVCLLLARLIQALGLKGILN